MTLQTSRPTSRHPPTVLAVRLLVPLTLLSFVAAPVPAAHAQNQLWIKQFGTSENDHAYALAPDSAGGVMIAGETWGALAGANAGESDCFLARYDSAGSRLWIRQFGTSNSEGVYALAPDGAGGVMVAGKTRGSLGGSIAGNWDAFLARYDNEGNRLWIRQFGSVVGDLILALAPDGAGGVMVAGHTWGNLAAPNAGNPDPFLARYDSTGNRLWIRQFGTGDFSYARALAPDGAGGVMVAGYTLGSLGGPNAGETDVFLARYDSAGNRIWIRQFGTSRFDRALALAPDGVGGVMVAGETLGSLGGPNADGYDAFLARYDNEGNQLWIRQFGTSGHDNASALAPDGAGGVVVVGATQGSLVWPSMEDWDAWLARYDSAGNRVWIRQFGTNRSDLARAVAHDGEGSVMVAGETIGSLAGPSAGGADVFLARFSDRYCYADCDQSTGYHVLDVFDFLCFQNAFVAGCSNHRASDWVPGAAHGTSINNPGPDPQGRPVWSYEWATGGPLGSGSPWYAQATQQSTWDEDWFGIGQGAWSRDDDANPPIFRNRMTHNIVASSWTDIPIVRWLNPVGNRAVVNLAGSLTVRWSGEGGLGSPVDVDVVIAMIDPSLGRSNVLFSATVSKPIPQPTIGDEIILPINLEGIALDEGDSIVISHRAVSDSGSIGRWIVLLDDVTLTGPVFGCYADCDGSGTLDIFDFLCFQDAFVNGCP